MTDADKIERERLERLIADLIWAADHCISPDDYQAAEARKIFQLARKRVEDWHYQRAAGRRRRT